MKKYIYEGKTLEQTLNLALYELNVNESDILYSSHEEKLGLLKGKKVVVECIKYSDVAEYGKELLIKLLDGMNINNPKIEKKIKNQVITFKIHSDNNSLLIGKKGHILDAVQTYIRQAVNNEIDQHIKVLIDVEDYKEKQLYFLQRDAKKIAREVLKTKERVELDPMNSYERKIIHDTLSKFKNIKSDSEGVEPNRRIVIEYIENNN